MVALEKSWYPQVSFSHAPERQCPISGTCLKQAARLIQAFISRLTTREESGNLMKIDILDNDLRAGKEQGEGYYAADEVILVFQSRLQCS